MANLTDEQKTAEAASWRELQQAWGNTESGAHAHGWASGYTAGAAEVEMLQFCLDQARIVLEHFKAELPDPEHRRLAEGALIASAPPRTLPGERPT
jgi:hypothetical protein